LKGYIKEPKTFGLLWKKIKISGMTTYLNAREIKENVSLADLLTRLGYQPARTTGKELMYKSMLRDTDTNPSLSVNDQLGVWFDHGTGKGGNVIDFGLAYWKELPFGEVLAKIQQVCNMTPSDLHADKPARQRKPVRIPHYIIHQVRDLGNNPAITDYLRYRGVWDIAQGRLQEVYYYVQDQKGLRKNFFAAGWANESGGWEVRNKYFKGCLGHKAISFIQGHQKNLAVFEGYFNYLSWIQENPQANESVIILNSAALLPSGIAKAKAWSSIDLYLDLDRSGIEATRDFIKALPYATDRSHSYEGYNDYNDKIRLQPLVPAIKR
jgi:hypothetical protein